MTKRYATTAGSATPVFEEPRRDGSRDRILDEPIEPDLLLEFPCHYQFKAFGPAGDAFTQAVKQAVGQVVAIDDQAMRTRPSSGGRYQSVTVSVHLHSSLQLKEIYAALREIENLKYLL